MKRFTSCPRGRRIGTFTSNFTLRAARPLQQATLLVLKTGPQPRRITVGGRPAESRRWNLHGFEFDAVTLDIAGEVNVQVA